MKNITLKSSTLKTLTTLALAASSLFAGSALANNAQDNGWVQTHTAQETYLNSAHLYCDYMDLESAQAECEDHNECNGFNFRSWDHTVCFKAAGTNANGEALPEYHATGTGYDVWVKNPEQDSAEQEVDPASYCGEHMGWDSDAELCIIQPEYITAAAQAVSAAAQCQNDLDRHHSELASMETQRKQSEQQIQDSTSSITMDFTTNYLRIVDNTGTSTPLTTCNQDDEFESNSPSPTSDRVCTSLTTCDRPNWDQSIAPTATTDRVCGLEPALQLRYCARIGFCSTAYSMGYTSTNWQNAYPQDFGAEECSGIGKNVLQEGIERAKRGQNWHSRIQFSSPQLTYMVNAYKYEHECTTFYTDDITTRRTSEFDNRAESEVMSAPYCPTTWAGQRGGTCTIETIEGLVNRSECLKLSQAELEVQLSDTTSSCYTAMTELVEDTCLATVDVSTCRQVATGTLCELQTSRCTD